jgi:hypothetical protein
VSSEVGERLRARDRDVEPIPRQEEAEAAGDVLAAGGGHRFERQRGSPFADVFDQIVAYAAGTPINVVNQSVLERGRARR